MTQHDMAWHGMAEAVRTPAGAGHTPATPPAGLRCHNRLVERSVPTVATSAAFTDYQRSRVIRQTPRLPTGYQQLP
jgi:hypothetical protein